MDIDSEESPQISRPHPLLIDHVRSATVQS